MKLMELFSKFTKEILYKKVKNNLLIIKSIKSKKTLTIKSQKPFSTKRLLIGEFSIVEELLKSSFNELNRTLFSPKVVIQPLENFDNPLSEVEDRVLKEVALSAGAKEVVIWIGKELSDDEVLKLFEK